LRLVSMGFVTGSETATNQSKIVGTWFPISPDFKLACEGSHDMIGHALQVCVHR